MTALLVTLRRNPTAVAVTVIICIVGPVVVAAVLMWSVAGRSAALSDIPVAIVNEDEPVTVGVDDAATTIAAGRQLTANLTNPAEPGQYDLDWLLTDAADAEAGLDSGRYYAVLTIPDTFSTALTSTSADTPEQAQITVQTNPGLSGLAGTISEQVAAAAADELGDQASTSYLMNVYAGFNTIAEQFASAATGATELTSGAEELATSTGTIDTGAVALAQNLTSLQQGAADIAAGTGTVSTGASALADGSAHTADAAQRTAQADAGLAEAIGVTAQAAGRLDGSAAAIADAAVALADECPATAGPLYCAHVRELAVGTRAQHTATTALARGLDGVAGAATDTAAASAQVAGATVDVSTGAAALAQSTAALSVGTGDLSIGAQSAAQGADELAAGTEQLSAGANSLAAAAQTLSTSLTTGAQSVPTYTDAEQETLARVVTDPIAVTPTRTDASEFPAWPVALIAAAVLWLGAIATPYLRRRLTRSDIVVAPESPARSALSTLSTAIAASVAQSIAVWITIACFGLPLTAAAATAGLTLLAGITFTLLALALTALTPRYAPLLAVTAFAAQLACASGALPIQTAPAITQTLNAVLPLTVYSNAFTDLTAGGAVSSAEADVSVLLIWAAVGFVFTMLIQSNRNAHSARQHSASHARQDNDGRPRLRLAPPERIAAG